MNRLDMATAFVTRKTARPEAILPETKDQVLIFGDEVVVQGPAIDGRVPVQVRGRHALLADDALGPDAGLELYFMNVGQGDAAFVVTPGRKKILVDGGENRQALGFLAWKYRLNEDVPDLEIDLMVVSHGDSDHLEGLTPIIEHPKIRVRRIVHSGIAAARWGRRAGLGRRSCAASPAGGTRSEPRDAPTGRSTRPARSSTSATRRWRSRSWPGDPAVALEVLAPRLVQTSAGAPAYPYFGDPAHTINGHSIVLRLTYDQVRILFSGDINIEGSRHLLGDQALADRLDSHVLKAPHHGSHEYEARFLDAVRPQIAVISSGDDPDHGHPRASYIGAASKAMRTASPLVFSTEIAADFVEEKDPPTRAESLASVELDASDATTELRRLYKKGRERAPARRVPTRPGEGGNRARAPRAGCSLHGRDAWPDTVGSVPRCLTRAS
jgi:competence protein ComEC